MRQSATMLCSPLRRASTNLSLGSTGQVSFHGMPALVAATPAGVTHRRGPFLHLSARSVHERAIKWDAQAIVTYNIRDFPEGSIGGYHVEVTHPDDFFVNQIDLDPTTAVRIIQELAGDFKAPPTTRIEVVTREWAQWAKRACKILR